MKILNLFLLFFFIFALNSYSLPECEGSDPSKWNNCKGTNTSGNGDKYVGEWKDAEKHGRGTMTYSDSGREVSGLWRNGELVE